MKFTAILQCPVVYSIYSFVYICIYIVTACLLCCLFDIFGALVFACNFSFYDF